jgi:hypothetical protein
MKNFFLIILCCFPTLFCSSQSIEKLIELHNVNMQSLRNQRGLEQWALGEVSKHDLESVLREYEQNVAMVFYTFYNDTLNFHLLTKYGQEVDTNYHIEKDSLVSLIELANQKFSFGSEERGPIARGAEAQNNAPAGISNDEAFDRVNKMLLPSMNYLSKIDHLIIVPTLNISILPFAAFRLNDSTYLIDEMSYSIAPSLFEIMVDNQLNSTYGYRNGGKLKLFFENALFVSNPVFSETSEYILPELPGTKLEVDSITFRLDSSKYNRYEGADATSSNVLNGICERDLLYFATHGISDPEDPLNNSFLALAEDKGKSSITTKEIQDLRFTCQLKADLVVLSACQTGLGKTHEGGIIGLGRAFKIAGAKHIVTSLWNISDTETARLMTLFFKHVQEYQFLTPHEALRLAMLEYKNNIHPDPKYWSAFSIIGIPYQL